MSEASERAAAAADEAEEETEKGPLRSGPKHWVALVRTTLYSVIATTWFVIVTTCCLWMLLTPPRVVRFAFRGWNRSDLWLMRVLAGQKIKIEGRENIPHEAALVAAKHQSAWETLALVEILPHPSMIMKKELMDIPLYGWFARHFGMISVDRAAGPRALKQLAVAAADKAAEGRQVVIFPEGTRRLVGAPPDYKIGAFFLYEKLGLPMVPVAHNSGKLWPRGRFVRYPGTITVSFMPAIPAGLKRGEARERLIAAIEAESTRLAAL